MIVELLFKEFEMVRLQKKRSNDYVINSGGAKFFKIKRQIINKYYIIQTCIRNQFKTYILIYIK